uniref:Uncharacterized protein n=1 Tax=Sarcophilus harrisii TaxID=9305 RepID=A0A7N4PHU0_SARHA
MEASNSFLLVLDGPWGPNPPKKLLKKLQCYFQSLWRSGVGECMLPTQMGCSKILLLFYHEESRQRVLERENHELELPGEEKLKLTVRLPTAKDEDEDNEEQISTETSTFLDTQGVFMSLKLGVSEDQYTKLSLDRTLDETEDTSKGSETFHSLVALKNLQDQEDEYFLVLLVENISGLSKAEGDFEVEAIPEAEAAVFTFLKHIVQEKKILVEPLEETRTILVENLPPNVNEIYIILFFENPNNGGGPITEIQSFPKDNSALIQFSECKGNNIYC